MKQISVFVCLISCSPMLSCAQTNSEPASSPESKPNILFILTDDQGYGDWSAHGHPLLQTPHVDQLWAQSVRFDNFYVSSACSPTRAALLTGMHEFRNGVTHTQQPREAPHPDATFLPQLLATAGYRNGFIGKWHLGFHNGFKPEQRGFDWCSMNEGGPRVHFDPVMIRNRKRTPEKGFREDIFFDDAMKFINETGDQPWFLYLCTYSPHDPLDAPEEFIAPFRGKVTDDQAAYLGMIANLDYNIGRLMKFLEDTGRNENTIVILMSDNGQTYGLDVFNAGMRGCKATIWEGGSRAFSFWRWTNHWEPHTINQLTAHIDVLPTLCQLAGVKLPEKIQQKVEGFSLVPLLEGDDWTHNDRLLYHHVGRWPGGLAAEHKYAMAGIRQGNYLLLRSRPCDSPDCNKQTHGDQCETLRNVEKGSPNANYTKGNAAFHWGVTPRDHWALYDVKKDPACENDLALAEPELTARLAEAYNTWWDDIYPIMVERGGDREVIWNPVLLREQQERSKKKPDVAPSS
jgi:arylsulfatase A-like enzyme